MAEFLIGFALLLLLIPLVKMTLAGVAWIFLKLLYGLLTIIEFVFRLGPKVEPQSVDSDGVQQG